MKRVIVFSLCALVFGGCISQNPYIPIRRYGLEESRLIETTREKPMEASVAVLDIRSRPRYEQRMLRRGPTGEMTYREYDRWVEQPSEMLSIMMARALTESGAFRNVGPARAFRTSEYAIDGDILSFEQVSDGQGNRAEFALRVEVRRVDDGRVLWSETITKSAPMNADSGAGLAEAMSKAAREAIKDAAGRIVAAAEKDFKEAVERGKQG
jgi:ABC-type uncharacterized transport system auxiliary subunit